MNNLIEQLSKVNADIEACEAVLNDGIDYGQEFYDEVHAEVKSLIKTAIRIKGQLVKQYGVVAI